MCQVTIVPHVNVSVTCHMSVCGCIISLVKLPFWSLYLSWNFILALTFFIVSIWSSFS